MKKSFKGILSLILAVAMVFTSVVLPAETARAEQAEGTVRLYCYIGSQTDEGSQRASDWGLNIWGGSATVTEKGVDDVAVDGWTSGPFPSFLEDEEHEGWAYIGLSSADITGCQIVNASGTKLCERWNSGIKENNLTAAYLKDGKWYTEIACENEVVAPEPVTYKIYFKLPEDTTVETWGINAWGSDDLTVTGNAETTVRPSAWGDGDGYPTLLADESLEGWGYVTLDAVSVTNIQFVRETGSLYDSVWDAKIADFIQDGNVTAYFNTTDGYWYQDAACENPISEIVVDDGVNEPGRTQLKLYYYITDADKNFADYGVNVWPETTTLSEAGPKLTVTAWSNQKYGSLLDANSADTIDGLSGKWGYVGLDSMSVEGMQFVTAIGGDDVWNSAITSLGLTEAYYVPGYGWFKDSAADEEIKMPELQNKFYIVGSHNEWSLETANEMAATDEGYELTLSLEAGNYEFTPVQDKDNFAWKYQYKDEGGKNYTFTLEDDRAVTFVVKNVDSANKTADVAVYKNYTVTFKDGDAVLDTQTVLEGSAATAPTSPVKEGYTFIGWDAEFDNVTSDLTVNAKWREGEAKTYTVTFKDGDTVLKVQTVGEGEAAMPPEDPTKEGYTFDGWDLAFGNVTSDLTVSAKWVKNEKNTYTVTFVDGNTVLKTQEVEEGAAATAPAAPTKTGYTFDGWDKAFDNITSDLTVNAKWKLVEIAPKTYTVIFKDGNTVLSSQTVAEGKAATAPARAKTGYTLSWDKAFGNVTADLTVNAKWTANTYKITYNVNGGSKLKTTGKTVTYDAAYGKLAVPKRTGYTFSGWYTAKTKGTKITAASSVKITANTTLYAHWSKVTKPAKVKKPRVKNSAKKTMKISFKKVKGAAGYEIRYSTKSNMKGAKKTTTKTTSKTIKKLTKGKTYYVQVRAYKLDSAGKKVYSKAYSTKAKVVIKK